MYRRIFSYADFFMIYGISSCITVALNAATTGEEGQITDKFTDIAIHWTKFAAPFGRTMHFVPQQPCVLYFSELPSKDADHSNVPVQQKERLGLPCFNLSIILVFSALPPYRQPARILLSSQRCASHINATVGEYQSADRLGTAIIEI